MSLLGDIAKVILIWVGLSCILAIASFATMGYTEIALLFLVTLMIPVAMIVYEHWKNRKR